MTVKRDRVHPTIQHIILEDTMIQVAMLVVFSTFHFHNDYSKERTYAEPKWRVKRAEEEKIVSMK